MANYLNSIKSVSLFRMERMKPYFVDKSPMIEELLPLIESGGSYVCITRPRRFGKSLMACMLAAFLEKGQNSEHMFYGLEIAQSRDYDKNRNAYHVFYFTLNEIPKGCRSYEQYIDRVESRILEDLRAAYSQCRINEEESLWDILNDIYSETEEGFVFVLDEWDIYSTVILSATRTRTAIFCF